MPKFSVMFQKCLTPPDNHGESLYLGQTHLESLYLGQTHLELCIASILDKGIESVDFKIKNSMECLGHLCVSYLLEEVNRRKQKQLLDEKTLQWVEVFVQLEALGRGLDRWIDCKNKPLCEISIKLWREFKTAHQNLCKLVQQQDNQSIGKCIFNPIWLRFYKLLFSFVNYPLIERVYDFSTLLEQNLLKTKDFKNAHYIGKLYSNNCFETRYDENICERTIHWFQTAKAYKDPTAAFHLGYVYLYGVIDDSGKDYNKVIPHLNESAKFGCSAAWLYMGKYFELQLPNKPADYALAKQCYEKAIQLHSVKANVCLAKLYCMPNIILNNIITPNYEIAEKLLQYAANYEYWVAMNELAELYRRGVVGKKENGKADMEKVKFLILCQLELGFGFYDFTVSVYDSSIPLDNNYILAAFKACYLAQQNGVGFKQGDIEQLQNVMSKLSNETVQDQKIVALCTFYYHCLYDPKWIKKILCPTTIQDLVFEPENFYTPQLTKDLYSIKNLLEIISNTIKKKN